MFRSKLFLILAGLVLAASSERGFARARAQDDPARVQLRELAVRAQRASFNAQSAELALGALTEGLDPLSRPVALFALGASGERAMSPRLESWAIEGGAADRRAAILGLREGGFASVELLKRLSHASVTEVSEAALLALALSPGDRARAALDQLSAPDAPESRAALRARDFAADPTSVPDFATGKAWLELRWDAARRYGLVDGQPWRAKLQGELAADQQFLDALVYGAASELHRVGAADHFLELALGGGPPERLRAVVNAIPNELDRVIEAGVWFPADQAEWAQLLFEIDERRLESMTLDVLRGARVDPDLSAYASVLMVRAGNFEGLSMLELDIASSDPQKRQRIAETLGGTREPHYIDLLESLRIDDDARVRTAAMIAQMRLGNSLSVESVRGALTDPAGSERATLVEELARIAYLPEISALLQEFFPGFSGRERLIVAIALAREGDSRHSAELRDALSEPLLRSSLGVHFVQALVRISANAEISTPFQLFPLEEAREVNVQLGLALCSRRDPAVLPLLRAALWQGPFVRSVLAGALIQYVAGIDALRIELDRPPKGAKPEEIRRVGFALGEWGGTGEVERLGRRRTAADPALQGAFLGALAARTH